MKKIFLQFIIIATPVIALVSCNKLDQQPRSAITTDQFYKTQSDAVAAVTAVYSELTYDAGEQPASGFFPESPLNRLISARFDLGVPDS